MARRVDPLTIGDVMFIIQQASSTVPPHQFLRELVQNSIEAGATRILVGMYEPYGDDCKLCVADNGKGMTAVEMDTYISGIASGGKAIGRQDNFGMGMKISTLPVSPSGVECMSWKEGIGNRIILAVDPETGEHGVLWDDNGQRVTRISDDAKVDIIDESGTVIVMRGENWDDKTLFTLGGEKFSQGWIPSYLNSRFFEIPDGIELKCTMFGKGDTVSGKRTVKGARGNLDTWMSPSAKSPESAGSKGSFAVDGVRFSWWTKGSAGVNYGITSASSSVLYRNELYELADNTDHWNRLALFGVAYGQTKVSLIVEPPEESIISSQDRTSLFWLEDGKRSDLPWGKWAKLFRENMPLEVTRAMESQISEYSRINDEEIDETVRRKYADLGLGKRRVRKYSKEVERFSDKSLPGDTPGTDSTRSTGADVVISGRNGSERSRNGVLPFSMPVIESVMIDSDDDQTPVPTVHFCDDQESIENSGTAERPASVVVVSREKAEIYVNPQFHLFDKIRDILLAEAGDSNVDGMVEKILRQEISERLKLVYMNLTGYMDSNRDMLWTKEERQAALSKGAMMTAVITSYEDMLRETRRTVKIRTRNAKALESISSPEVEIGEDEELVLI